MLTKILCGYTFEGVISFNTLDTNNVKNGFLVNFLFALHFSFECSDYLLLLEVHLIAKCWKQSKQ